MLKNDFTQQRYYTNDLFTEIRASQCDMRDRQDKVLCPRIPHGQAIRALHAID